ncbi:unnamed protein product [Vitrella brassicaformis CCMP3155]|uniref:GST N-terminal domain-containing protein n=1 Tax=Vitrella brassicaformis (strain CCMP3155) TaxID=1169540 RepID=A0A0G4EU95_VITBC|nr:unnamed protein product [Vitrella brassicaformis CCMP3155]|eukprot:CEM02223.1 unnamed protein product [Vitrella brassicaformis CCMP3155]
MGEDMISGGFSTKGEPPIQIRGFSLAKATLLAGSVITLASFWEFFGQKGGSGLGSLGFIYGVPILLIGVALQYAELEPCPVRTTSEADRMFDAKATETIKKIKEDVTRHRYGDDAHLDTTVESLGLWPNPEKEPPQLQYIQQGVSPDGELEFMMVWKSETTPFRMWCDVNRVLKFDRYFGPGVWAQTVKVDGPNRLVGIKLTTGERKAPPVDPLADVTEQEIKATKPIVEVDGKAIVADTEAPYTLFYFPEDPFSRKVMEFMEANSIDQSTVALKNIMESDKPYRNQLMALGGSTQVPALQTSPDSVMYGSGDIISHLQDNLVKAPTTKEAEAPKEKVEAQEV